MESPFGHNTHHHHHHHQRNDDHETPPFLESNQFAPPPPSVQGREFPEVSHVRHAAHGSPNYPPPRFDPPPPTAQVSHVHHDAAGSPNYPPPRFDPPPSTAQVRHVHHDAAGSPNYHPPRFDPAPPIVQVSHVHHDAAGLPNYPPPQFDHPPPPPPIVQVSHVHHGAAGSVNYPPHEQPPPAEVSHVVHELGQERVDHGGDGRHSFRPHMPTFFHSHSPDLSELFKKPTVKVYCKADPGLSLTIRDSKVILTPSSPSDGFQRWYKDEKYSTKVKDKEGFPCFALVNKVTGQAMKHSVGDTHPVQLVPYNPDVLDESVLWTESKDLGDGYRAVRMVNNIHLNLDAFHGDKKSGGVHDGTIIVLREWTKGDNQRWRIMPYCKFLNQKGTCLSLSQ